MYIRHNNKHAYQTCFSILTRVMILARQVAKKYFRGIVGNEIHHNEEKCHVVP